MESLCLEVLKRHVDVALGIWYSGEHGAAGLMVRLSDLKGLFQT